MGKIQFNEYLGDPKTDQNALEEEYPEAKLPYYDFILVGHSTAGKTTFFTMLCEQGGEKNQSWSFSAGGSALDLSSSRPSSVLRKKNEWERFNDAIDRLSQKTQKYIDNIVIKIKNLDGAYSNITKEELVFKLRHRKAKSAETILTLDYPGEWISTEKGDDEPIKRFIEHLAKSQALVVVIDPLAYLVQGQRQMSLYTRGLERAANLLRTAQRDKGLVSIRKMPVAVIITKADQISGYPYWDNGKKKSAKVFLKKECRILYDDIRRISRNWKAFFISCYGLNKEIKPMGKGVFIPPIDPEPVGLIEPLDWLNKTRRKREASKTRRKFATIGLILISIVGGVFFWDYKAYQKVEAIEQAYAQEPAKIYGEYSKFIKMHLFSEITGYRQKALEKCQKKIEQYLTAKNRIPEYMSVNDYKSLIAQLREWCLELSDRTFTRKIESDIQSDVLPNLEIVYANELEAEINQVEFEAKFMEFVSSFPKSRFIRRFHGKKLYMQIYQLVGSQKKIDIKKFKRIISLCDRYQKETSKYGSEYRESIQKLRLFLDKLKTNKTMGREHMIVYNGYAIQDGLLGTHKELHKKCEDVPVKKYRSEGLWIFKRVVPYTAWEERCQDEWVDTFNSPEVIVKVIVNESEVFRSKPNNHKKNLTHDVFRFYWTPGNRITVAIENKTGQSVQKRQGGLLGINILQGDLDIGNVATVRFQGRDLEIPTLQVP